MFERIRHLHADVANQHVQDRIQLGELPLFDLVVRTQNRSHGLFGLMHFSFELIPILANIQYERGGDTLRRNISDLQLGDVVRPLNG